MKRIFTFCLAFAISFVTQAQLTAGDIAIIAMNADNNASPILGENFVFIALKDIPANTTITFTDNGWNAAVDTFRTNEGYVEWSHTSLVPAGTVIVMNSSSSSNSWAAPMPSLGAATGLSNMAFSTDGDQLIAFEGTWANRPTSGSSSKFLYAFSLENFITTEPTSSQVSNLPASLASFSVAMKNSATETDNAYFADGNAIVSAVNISGTKAELLTKFKDSTLYYQSNTLSALPTYSITLPISLTSFNGSITNNKALLQWQTSSEINFSHFEIEKSINAVQFNKVGVVNSTNNNGGNYSFIDATINGTAYYRLKSIDKDGTFSYSKTIQLENAAKAVFQAFPNPVVDRLVINHPAAKHAFVQVLTIDGKVIVQQQIAAAATQTIVNTSKLVKGNYIVQLNNNGSIENQLITK